MKRLVLLLLLTVAWVAASAASFDCSKAHSKAESLICADPELSRLDDQLARKYTKARTAAADLKAFNAANSREWRRRERECTDKDCVVTWYIKRDRQLQDYLEAPTRPVRAASEDFASGKWYAYRPDAPTTMGCKNPSFIAEANKMLRGDGSDPFDKMKQEGCTMDWIAGMGNDPMRFKFKVVRKFEIDGVTVLETSRAMYNPNLRQTLTYTLFVQTSGISPRPVAAPTEAELRAEAQKLFGQ
jgi:uncharacterized protein